MSTQVFARMQQRYDTAANWTAENPILLDGEMGIESDTNKFKFGDGVLGWNALSYASSEGGAILSIDDIDDVDLSGPTASNGRALIYLDGKWIPGPVLGPKNTATDQYYNQVVLSLHFDGVNNGTAFIDSSPNPATLVRLNGLVTSSAQVKFGTASAYFRGASYINSVWTGGNDGLQLPSNENSRFNLGTQDFTIEAWIRTKNNRQTQPIITNLDSTLDTGFQLELSYGKIRFVYQKSGSTAVTTYTGNLVIPNYTWTHIALVRKNGTFKAFIDGIPDSATLTNSESILGPTRNSGTFIGTESSSSSQIVSANIGEFSEGGGYLDDLRVTVGVARYDPSTSFVPPVAANPDAAATGNGSIVYSLNALDDVDVGSATNGQALIWNGTNWMPATVATGAQGALANTSLQPTSSINALADVDTSSAAPSNGQVLQWDSTAQQWEPASISTGATNIDELSDVDVNAEHVAPLADGRALIYVNGKWQAGPVIGGYSYNTGNDALAASVRLGSSFNTNFLDETGYWDQVTKILTVTTSGSPAISTSQKKYGTASLSLPSSSYVQYTSSTHASALALGTSDFCIEFWAYNTASSGARGLLYYAHSSGGGISFTIVSSNVLIVETGFFTLGASASWASGWNHIAFVRDAGVFKLYQNGVQQATNSTSINFTGFQEFRLGYSNPASPYYLNGNIDDLRITIGAARYTSNFTPPTGAILGEEVVGKYSIGNLSDVDTTTAAPTEGQILKWDSSTQKWEPGTITSGAESIDDLVDVDISAETGAVDGSALVFANGKWQAGPVIGGISYANGVDPDFDKVVALLRMDGANNSTTFTDLSSYGRSFTNSGAAISTSQSVFGGSSAFFNGSSRITAVADPALHPELGLNDFVKARSVTVECWVRFTSAPTSSGMGIFSILSSGGYWPYTLLMRQSDTQLFFGGYRDPYNGDQMYVSHNWTPNLNQWYHIVGQTGSESMSLYIDGVRVASRYNAGLGVYYSFWTSSSNLLQIGDQGGNPNLTGFIDDFRLTIGKARYGTTYTVPTVTYPAQGPVDIPYVIDNLEDVDTKTTAPSNGQVLTWNGTKWIPSAVSVPAGSINALTDVDTATTAPSSSQSLVWNGTNWVPGFPELRRLSLDHTTASLAVDSAEDFTIASGDVFQLLSITASTPAWIRIYGTSAARTADTRTEPGGTFPAPGSEFYAEIVTDTPAEQVRLAPIPTILATSGLSYVRVVNRDTSSQAIALQFQTIVMDA